MSTFGRGVRVEYKRITATLAPSPGSVFLQTPANAPYFIFLNQILGLENSNNQIQMQQLRKTTGGGGVDWRTNLAVNVNSTDAIQNIDFFGTEREYGSGKLSSGGSNEDPDYSNIDYQWNDNVGLFYFGSWTDRIMHPNKRLIGFGSGGSPANTVEVYYQEVYFGGKFSY